MNTLSPTAMAISHLIDVQRDLDRAIRADEGTRAVILHDMYARVQRAVVNVSAAAVRDAARMNDCQGEYPARRRAQ